jgi:hypothetical protein
MRATLTALVAKLNACEYKPPRGARVETALDCNVGGRHGDEVLQCAGGGTVSVKWVRHTVNISNVKRQAAHPWHPIDFHSLYSVNVVA